jgi:nicotinamide-nucleotide amidase
MRYNLELINSIKEILVKKQLTLAVAESVTAGHIQAALSAATDASFFFQGGITAYNAGQKTRHLRVEPIHALKDDCVSLEVGNQMAISVNDLFLSYYGIAITGYATTIPEKDIMELYAFFSIAAGDKIILSRKIESNFTNSIEVQIDYTNQVLESFHAILSSNP